MTGTPSTAVGADEAHEIKVPKFATKFVSSWPKEERAETVPYVPLSRALVHPYRTDAHFAAYSVPAVGHRLAHETLAQLGELAELEAIPMVLAVFDVDGGGHVLDDDGWLVEKARIAALFERHPGGFAYRTKGGYRLVYRLAEPFVLRTVHDAARWTARYLAWCDYLEAEHGIVADRACKEWQRLYRLPRVTRDGKLQQLETIGDPSAIGTWDPPVEVREPEPPKPKSPRTTLPREGEWDIREVLAVNYGGAKEQPGQGRTLFHIDCPWEHEHSGKTSPTATSVIVFDTGAYEFKCLHAHCADRTWEDFRRFHQPDWTPYEQRPPRSSREEPPHVDEEPEVFDPELEDEPEFETPPAEPRKRTAAEQVVEALRDMPPPPAADDVPPPTNENPPGPGLADLSDAKPKKKRTIATILVELAQEHAELWHATDGTAYATITAPDGHRENIVIGAKAYRLWLAKLGWSAFGAAVGESPLKTAATTLQGIAIHDGKEYPTHVRVAGDGKRVWIDLVDKQWRAIEIDSTGWRIVSSPPVRFVRSGSMRPLPEPTRGGRLDAIREHVRITDESWPLVVAWLVGAFNPRGPYPVLVFRGHHGAGKSWGARNLRSLIDPSVAPIRSEPREPRDLVITARASHVSAFDNLSSVPPWLSDGLCRLATGGGYAARGLFTDGEEFVFDVQRPAILTGITDVVTAPDLLDRSLLVELDAIPPRDRKQERVLEANWQRAQPGVLGALCDAVSMALCRLDRVRFDELPRLADWAAWATAAEPALGLADGSVLRALNEQNDDKVAIALEDSLLVRPLRELVESRIDKRWCGTAGELLAALDQRVSEATRREQSWPKKAKGLANQIARIASALLASGLKVDRPERGAVVRGQRAIVLSIVEPPTGDGGDGGDD